jgi:hypothetical protein
VFFIDDVGVLDLGGHDQVESEVDYRVHDSFDCLDGLFLVVGAGFVVGEDDIALGVVGEDEGLVGPLEEVD